MPMTKPNYSQPPIPVVIVKDATNPYPETGGGGGGGGSSDTTEATQLLVLGELQNLDTDVGALTDAAAPADGTGDYSIISAFKRALLNGASLLARIPASLGAKTSANSFPVVLASDQSPLVFAGYDPVGNKQLVGTARERFFENFATFDTIDTWEVMTTGPGMTVSGPLGGAAAGSTPYLNINSGTTSGSETIILSRSIFQMPLDVRYQISASQRIANNRAIVALLECDETGALITSTAYGSGAELLNARNAVGHMHDGTTATTAQLIARAAGSAVDIVANAFGTGFTTVATGTGPNFLAATTYGFMAERDRINSRAWGQNLTTNTGAQFGYDRVMVNPTKLYRLALIVENNAAPATATDWRFHMINVMDATRFDISPRNAGSTDQSKAMGVIAHIVGGVITTLSTVTAITTSGTPAAPATPLILNSAATTNGQLVLTGSSGLHAFYATNTGAAAAYVKLYNKATAPTVGTDTPAMIIVVPAAVGGVPGVATLPIGHNGFRFALGLGLAITGGAADADTTAVAAGQVKVMLSRTA